LNTDTNCYFCKSPYLIEQFPKRGNHADLDARAYKCTSSGHTSKPQVLKCLVCDLNFAADIFPSEKIDELYSNVVDKEYLNYKMARKKHLKKIIKKMLPICLKEANS